MGFKSIRELTNARDKSFFDEKIDVLIRIVAAACKKYSLALSDEPVDAAYDYLTEIGIIVSDNDLPLLKEHLGETRYNNLLCAISTAMRHEAQIRPLLINLNNRERRLLQEKEKNRDALTLVDLFCGAGGLSLGFKQCGYKTVFANDFDPLCIETYKYNHPEIPSDRIVCGDIRLIADHIDRYVPEPVDVVVGGPPCQGFSSANKHHRVIDDPRNELYKYFLKATARLAPKIVVMENVKGMLKVADQVVEDYGRIQITLNGRTLSYTVSYELLNSADFSVAQSRERLIYIAIRSDLVEELGITPSAVFATIRENNSRKPVFNLSSALEGVRSLVAPHKMNVGEIDTEEGGRKIDANPFCGNENEYLSLINQGRVIPLVFNHKARYCSELNYEIYKRMNPGDDATDPKIADIMPYAHRNDKFKDKYYRLYADRPCRTITAHLRSDCHSHIHPTEDRAITPREAARVQSFPDDYLFLGPYLKTYIQIGNAVPTLMAREIAQVIWNLIGE